MNTPDIEETLRKIGRLACEVGENFTHSNSISQLMGHFARAKGWQAWTEVSAPYAANGRIRKGRIDLMVVVDGLAVGIESDNRVIKTKSIAKLQSLNSLAARVCVISGEDVDLLPDGIDAVVSTKTQRMLTRSGLTVCV